MRLTEEAKKRIVDGVMNGKRYEQLVSENQVSIGTVANVIAEQREQIPDFDDLRRLNVALLKRKCTVDDAVKGLELMESLGGLGLTLSDLEEYLRLSERLLRQEKLPAEFIGYAVEFMRLSKETGLPYKDFVAGYQRKISENRTLQAAKEEAGAELDAARAETKRVKAELARLTQQVRRMRSLSVGVKRVGLDKLERIVEFVPAFEALNFNVQMVTEFGRLKLKMDTEKLDFDQLESYVDNLCALASQHQLVEEDVEKREIELQELSASVEEMRQRHYVLERVDSILTSRSYSVPCKRCGSPIWLRLENFDYYYSLLARGSSIAVFCYYCGLGQQVSVPEMIWQIASSIISPF